MMKRQPPPTTVEELLTRAQNIAGLSVKELCERHQLSPPTSLRRGKGWTGQLCEWLLGSDAGCEAKPDFTELNIELKTIPVTPQGKPLESTFVCNIHLLDIHRETWPTSRVYHKCQQVLWIPIVCLQRHDLINRQIGMPLLWRPSAEQEAQLAADWQELVDMMCLGELEKITAQHGKVLQVRPKGANAKDTVWGTDAEGNKTRTLPRGFYLRSRFTQTILQTGFGLSD